MDFSFGRRIGLIVTAWIFLPAGLMCSFAPTYLLFIVFRVTTVFGILGHHTVLYCYGKLLIEILFSREQLVITIIKKNRHTNKRNERESLQKCIIF